MPVRRRKKLLDRVKKGRFAKAGRRYMLVDGRRVRINSRSNEAMDKSIYTKLKVDDTYVLVVVPPKTYTWTSGEYKYLSRIHVDDKAVDADTPQPRPRVGLLPPSEDPTLAERFEEELYRR